MHRGARPEPRAADDRLVSLGGTVGFRANGAVSNVAITPLAVSTLREHLRHGRFDVVHIHEPVVPMVSWDAMSHTDAALVGTFHSYSTHWLSNALGNLAGAKRRKIGRAHV